MTQRKITDDLDVLMEVLPENISKAVTALEDGSGLLEIIMDLGRVPTARLVSGEVVLSQTEITRSDIDYVVERLGEFDADNRGGIERTLHRISAIRNRRGDIVGLTCRVGRAVYGTIDIIEDLINEGKSLLILGRPGVGKTTLLREAARILAESKRVVIVDTSNEIGGDGDVPHPAVGRARRMQVATPSLQHEVMIEAVENHNPEVIVIDEIGRQREAEAARTIAERGVQLIGTAHGNSLENLLLNPTLSDLIGGIESVTLSDEEARRRGTQKTVLERRSPPTFDILVEIQNRDTFAVHLDVSAAVDALLRNYDAPPEVRTRLEDGTIDIKKAPTMVENQSRGRNSMSSQGPVRRGGAAVVENGNNGKNGAGSQAVFKEQHTPRQQIMAGGYSPIRQDPIKVFAYGVARNRLENAARYLGVPVVIAKDLGEAQVMLTLRTYYRKRQRIIVDAERRGMPVYVLRANTSEQMERFLGNLFDLSDAAPIEGHESQIVNETRDAIEAVLNGERWVELPPADSRVRRLQHNMAHDAKLVSHSYGKEPHRRVRIFRE